MPEAGKDPMADPEGHDTDEQFADHPELAPSESRISQEKVKDLRAESHRRSLAGEPVEDAGDEQPLRNIEAIRREESESQGDWSAHPMDIDSEVSQGREVSRPRQATGSQPFGRDEGAAGLEEEDREGLGAGKPQPPNHKIWAAILRRLGGSSPGSEENLELARLFQRVQFPSDKDGVLSRMEPGAEFRLKEGIVVDLHQAVEHSRTKTFRNLNDLVDAVKDELRRQEADGLKVMKMA